MMSRAVGIRSFSQSDLPIALPCAARKVLAMPPPMISVSTLVMRLAKQIELGRDLGAADDRGDRTLRVEQRALERVEFFLHGAAGIDRQQMRRWPRPRRAPDARPKKRRRHRCRRAWRALRRNPDRSSSSPLWKRVFSRQRMSPGFIAATAFSATCADAVVGKGDGPADDLARPRRRPA